MNDIGNVLLAACGFGTICCGGLAVGAFLLLRVTGSLVLSPTLMGLFTLFRTMFKGDDDGVDEIGEVPLRADRLSPVDSIRARAQAADEDFHQKLQRGQSGDAPPPPSTLSSGLRDRASQIKGSSLLDDAEIPSLRKRRGKRDERDIIGFDEDGDDLIDF